MSRQSLPSTPLPGTPNLRLPSPARTPSPLPLFSTGGPYTYTGLITRKYEARFKAITKKKTTVRDLEQRWKTEAKEKGLSMEELVKSQEAHDSWEEERMPQIGQSSLHESMSLDGEGIMIEEGGNESEKKSDKRMSVDDEHFVDALTSPFEKPKEWGDMSLGGNAGGHTQGFQRSK